MKSITLRGLPHPVSDEVHAHILALGTRIEKLEAALNEVIKLDQDFYDACDYCYDEEEQCRADGESTAYAACREIAEEGLKP